jgi:hypothetical protein
LGHRRVLAPTAKRGRRLWEVLANDARKRRPHTLHGVMGAVIGVILAVIVVLESPL